MNAFVGQSCFYVVTMEAVSLCLYSDVRAHSHSPFELVSTNLIYVVGVTVVSFLIDTGYNYPRGISHTAIDDDVTNDVM